MNDNKNIDRLFQEKFKDFEVSPPDVVWENIKATLQEKKKRRVIPFWFRLSGVAAALLIGFFVIEFSGLFSKSTNVERTVVTKENSQTDNSKDDLNTGLTNPAEVENQNQSEIKLLQPVEENNYQTGVAAKTSQNNQASQKSSDNKSGRNTSITQNRSNGKIQTLKSNVNVVAIADKNKQKGSASESKETNGNNKSPINASVNENKISTDNNQSESQIALQQENKALDQNTGNKNPISAPADEKTLDSTAIATVVPNALEELLKEKETKVVTENEPKLNRWQISSNVAPIYFSSTSNNSPIDPTLAQSGKDYKADLTYGLGVRYAINSKITIRAGVNTMGMNYYTKDLSFSQTTFARSLANVDTNLQGSLIHVEGKKPVGPNSSIDYNGDGRKFSSSINQRTGYIEVPIEMSYKLLNKKFGIELIGGVSTLFLNENSISLVSSGLEMEIGKANNLSETHFSTNVGIGFNYNFLKNFDFRVEPMFKYQVNTFNNSEDVNPYLFGLYTGINYRF